MVNITNIFVNVLIYQQQTVLHIAVNKTDKYPSPHGGHVFMRKTISKIISSVNDDLKIMIIIIGNSLHQALNPVLCVY